MKNRFGYLAFAVLALAFFLVWTFPADRAYWLLQNRSESLREKVWMADIQGSVWSGKAGEAVIHGVEFRNLNWSVKPWSLLVGRLQIAFRLQVEDGAAQGTALVGRQRLEVKKLMANLPVSLLSPFLSDMGIGANGMLVANLDRFALQEGLIVAVDGRIAWSGAEVIEPQKVRLGDMKTEWTTLDEEIQGELSDGGGPLQAQGTARLMPDGRYEFNGALGARDRSQSSLNNVLSMLGKPGKDGTVSVALSGKLAPFGLVEAEK